MKKLIFGCALMICGVNAAIGWVIAACSLYSASSILSAVTWEFAECILLLLFIAVAAVGAVIAIKSLKDDK